MYKLPILSYVFVVSFACAGISCLLALQCEAHRDVCDDDMLDTFRELFGHFGDMFGNRYSPFEGLSRVYMDPWKAFMNGPLRSEGDSRVLFVCCVTSNPSLLPSSVDVRSHFAPQS